MASNIQATGIGDTLRQLGEADYGSHYLLTYPEISVWRKIYAATSRRYLEDGSMVLIIPFYETTDSVRQTLSEEMDIKQYAQDGSLAIIDSIKAYFSEIGLMTFVDGLLKHAKSAGKTGLCLCRHGLFPSHAKDAPAARA